MVGPVNNSRIAEEGVRPWRARLGRVVRRFLKTIVWSLAGLAVILATVVLVTPLRTSMLEWGLGLAGGALPGHLTVARVQWPALGHLVLEDVLWVDDRAGAEGDTLADFALMDLVLDLGALGRRQARVPSLQIKARQLDIPAVTAAAASVQAAAVPDSTRQGAGSGEIPFLKAGSVPGVPWLALDDLDITADLVILGPGWEMRDARLAGRVDTRPGRPASVVVDHASMQFQGAGEDTVASRPLEAGVGHLGLGVALDFTTTADGTLSLVSAELDSLNLDFVSHDFSQLGGEDTGTEPVNLWATGRVAHGAGGYDGRLHCDFVLPGSRFFRTRLPEDFPHDEFGRVTGSLTLEGELADPEARLSWRLDLGSNTWLEKGVIAGEAWADVGTLGSGGLTGVSARLDTLDLAIPGITAFGSGHWSEGDGALELNLAVEDLQLPGLVVARLNPGLRDLLVDTKRMKLEAEAGVRLTGKKYSGQVHCRFDLPGSATFRKRLPDDFPHERFDALVGEVSVAGEYAAPRVSGSVNLDLGANTWLDQCLVAGEVDADLDQLEAGDFRSVIARIDTLAFSMGGLSAEGSGDWERGAGDLGLALKAMDIRIPDMVLDLLDPGLKADWADTDRVSLETTADLHSDGSKFGGKLDCRFDLPGSDHFRPWLPADFPHEEFKALVGDISLDGSYEAPLAKGEFRLDLSRNPWADQGLVVGSATADVLALKQADIRDLVANIETLEFAGLGLKVSAAGSLEPGIVDLKLDGELTDGTLPLLFLDPRYSDADMNLKLKATIGGSLEDPVVDARIGGRFLEQAVEVPDFDFQVKGSRQQVAVRLHAGGGLRYRTTYLDSLEVEVGGELAAMDTLLVNYGLAVWSPTGSLLVGGSARGDSLREITVDSLLVHGFGEDLEIRQPVSLTLGPGPGEFRLTHLEMSGNPGSITAEGFNNEQGVALKGNLEILLKENLLQLVAPSPLWSQRGGVDLKLEASADLEGTGKDPAMVGRIRASLLPHRREPPFGVELEFTSRGGEQAGLKADFSLTSADSTILGANLDWPGQPDPKSGFWAPDPEQDLVLTVPTQQLDLKKINRRLPDEVVLNGKFDLGGQAHVFPPGKQEAEPDSLAIIPLRGSIEGFLSSPNLRIDLPHRSWLETVVDAKVEGPLADPLVKARVEVRNGFIRIPEIPRNLHPTEGPSLLWALNDSHVALADTVDDNSTKEEGTKPVVLFRPVDQAGPVLDPTQRPLIPKLDLELVLTNDLRIIGYGADLKLLGGVKVARGFDKDNLPGPAITGDIRVREGNLKIMNRLFVVERGNIKFTGSVPPNPHLDMMLESQVNAYLVRILVSGRAVNPIVELTSDPDLSEDDIMAVLLFGQPMNDLDTDQRGRVGEENDPSRELQKNLAGLAMAFGTKGLQDSMSETFGVDVVQMGSDSSGGSTLMVGKFITPNIMVKYNQSLEKSGTYFMTLEYTLSRFFKVMTTYGQGDEDSGAQLQWSRRY